MSPTYLFFFLITAAANATAQLLLKRGAGSLSEVLSATGGWGSKLIKIFTNPFVVAAAIFLAAGMVLWIKLIGRVELSKAYPVNIALTIIITSLFSILFFGESVSGFKVAGTGLIIAGLFLILGS